MRLWIILALLLGTVTSPTQSLESYRSGTLVMGKVIDLSGEDTNRKSATIDFILHLFLSQFIKNNLGATFLKNRIVAKSLKINLIP